MSKKPRINVSLDENELFMLSSISKKRKQSISSIAKSLIGEALELQEDIFLSELSEKRVIESKGKRIKHESAWN
jgi:hypothetical protein